jgi:hypothetical protein
MKSRWLITLAAIVTLTMSACTQQLSSGAMEYSTAFDHSIPAGQSLPGTDIKYLGKTEQGAQMSIGGQTTLKRTLDSLAWRGGTVPGVNVDYNLRIVAFDDKVLQAGDSQGRHRQCPGGRVAFVIAQDALMFRVWSITIAAGQTIHRIVRRQNTDGAKLGGMKDFERADLIAWFGKLSDKCFLHRLRLVIYRWCNASCGTATLYLVKKPGVLSARF